MNKKWTTSCIMSFLFASTPLLLEANAGKENKSVHNNQVVATRLGFLDMSFRVKVTPVVQRKIQNYVTSGREKTNIILQSMAMYKPIFDKFIEEKNLPKELAYLPVVESAVDPHAKSHAGAVGLWQFMAPTARAKGLPSMDW
jgi:membrane-bound lytic murein transglycosylase D